jgi:hypothetical protein
MEIVLLEILQAVKDLEALGSELLTHEAGKPLQN